MAKIKIDLPEKKIKFSANIKEKSHTLLTEYRIYLSKIHNTNVTHDVILDALIENITKDKDFKKFKSQSAKSEKLKAGANIEHKPLNHNGAQALQP